ncbi:MAG: recombinase family protein [Lachnospiraceae bacterium]|nr:recombinase family protein [Lachnospiraceae bacterium]
MAIYGYVRVSSKDQNPDRQLKALKKRKVDYIYVDKFSGKDFERPAYKKMISQVKEGDLIIIKSIDRLGRNYQEILEQWRTLTKEIKVNIEVLDMPLLNTTVDSNNGLTGIFISDLVLQILAYVAETERTFIRQRQKEGIAVAKEKGVQFGRNKIEEPEKFNTSYLLWKNEKMSIRKAAELCGMSYTTFYRRAKERENVENCSK